jgi:hypothetical protein
MSADVAGRRVAADATSDLCEFYVFCAARRAGFFFVNFVFFVTS